MKRLTIVIAALVLFAACGDDGGGVSLDDYFASLEAAGSAYDEASAPIDEAFENSTDPVTDLKALFPPFLDDLKAFVSTLEGMSAPAEVSAEHAATVIDGKAAVAAFEPLVADLARVEDLAGLYALLNGPVMGAVIEASGKFSDDCTALQAVADEEGIDVDLSCG
jgi:hypothetical protein